MQRTLFCTVLGHGVHVAALVHDSTFRHDHVGLRSAPMVMPRRRGGTRLHCNVRPHAVVAFPVVHVGWLT